MGVYSSLLKTGSEGGQKKKKGKIRQENNLSSNEKWLAIIEMQIQVPF